MQRAEPAHQESAAHGGQPLEAGPRHQFQSSFGIDLSGVRVHTDAQANEANQALGARAFTYGSDIFLGSSASPAERVSALSPETRQLVGDIGYSFELATGSEIIEGLEASSRQTISR